MHLLAGEQVVFNLDSRSPNLRLFASDNIILTTCRIRYEARRLGYIQITSILLEQLASIQITQTSNPILLILAFIVFIGGLFVTLSSRSSDGSAIVAGIAIALLFVIGYCLGRREVLVLTASGATIKIGLRRVGTQFTQKFIDDVEAAKNARYMIGKSLIQSIISINRGDGGKMRKTQN